MSLLLRFTDFIQREHLFKPDEHLLVAVSGGMDSIVLAELCYQAAYSFEIAHCNFRLRGDESERDQEFVEKVAANYNVSIKVKEFDTKQFANQEKLSIQEAARKLRYEWFSELVNPCKSGEKSVQTGKDDAVTTGIKSPTKVLTAHHADDNIETVLMNFFRGTGMKGLRGILPRQHALVRPMLNFRRHEIAAFAAESNLTWVEDSSNQLDTYSRNYFRLQIIPAVKKIFPEAEHNLFSNLQRFRDIEILYQQSIEEHLKRLLEEKGNEVHIPVLKLKHSNPLSTIVYEIIKRFDFTAAQVDEVTHLLDSASGKYVASPSHRIIRNRNWLIITPKKFEESKTIVIDSLDTEIPFENGTLWLRIETGSKLPSGASTVAQLDATNIRLPLLLRKWKTGDYFYPLGMKKKKKLSRFFIDQKLSIADKERVWVVEMQKKIIWVVGLRIDDRFKVQNESKNTLIITLKRQELTK